MLQIALVVALLAWPPMQTAGPSEAPPAQLPNTSSVQQGGPDEAIELGDVVVEGRRLEEVTEHFVREVGAPARGRGLARWRDGVCVGVVNLQNDAAQYIVDRVSTVAEDLGLTPGAPGCDPSVLIIATADANAFTPRFVEMRPRLFIVGGGGMDLGRTALDRFKTNDQPVRWWIVSAPVDSDTGDIATRLPGQAAPSYVRRGPSRQSTQIVDDTQRAFVIVDVTRLGAVSLTQLGDYLAMVVLSQVDPDADTRRYATVLNVFDDPDQTSSLTDWDKAYLEGLYDAQRTRINRGAHQSEIAASIARVHRRMTLEADMEDTLATDDPVRQAP